MTLRPVVIALLAGFACSRAVADTPSPQQQIDQLRQQITDLQTQLGALAGAQPAVSPKLAALEKISLWGYGEIYANSPIHNGQRRQVDLARAVFGIGSAFDDATRFNSEFEIEHAVSASQDQGEFEVEQLYVDHALSSSTGVTTGLFLIPAGLLNESHEPTNFYGVQRNFVENLIIPTTWREGGVALHGDTESGLRWNVGITTDQDLSKWEFNPEKPTYTTAMTLQSANVAPLQATHQELEFANAQHLAQYVSVNYLGISGATVGGSVFSGLASNSATPQHNQRITLWEIHSRWQPGKADLSALYASGTISHTDEANVANPGASNPLPAAFYGYYGQAAYTVWSRGDARLAPFLRAERYNMGSRFEGLAPGFGATPGTSAAVPWPHQADTVYTVGANYYLNANVVIKLDYQNFRTNTSFTKLDLGLGLAF